MAKCLRFPVVLACRSEYDRGVNTFSPEGRLFQVEYAIEAIKLGSTSIGVQTKEGVVLAVEKRVTSPLLEPASIEKIMEIDSHIGCAMSGLTADARTLIEHGRSETQNHYFTFNEPMPAESCTLSLCDKCLAFGEVRRVTQGDDDSMSRPFGVALLVAAWDEREGPVLYHTDPSGTYVRYKAKAIGAGSEGAQAALQEDYNAVRVTWGSRWTPFGHAPALCLNERWCKLLQDLTLKEAEVLALKTLKAVMEEKVTAVNVDIAVVAPTFKLYSKVRLRALDRVHAARNSDCNLSVPLMTRMS
eukprot:scaffold2149_cov406-Prasinococcus_capsulatus_cf.AAC.8